MDRRAFLGTLAGGLLAAPLAAEAQQDMKVPQIGILPPGPLSGARLQFWEAFRQGLRDLGYIEGRNIVLMFPSIEVTPDRLADIAASLVRLKVDLIVSAAESAIRVAKQATTAIPIVMAAAFNPVEDGLVMSLAHPGGNITGLSVVSSDLSGKRLELLKEAVPGLSRVAVLLNPAHRSNADQMRATEGAARALGVSLQPLAVSSRQEFTEAFQAATKGRAGGLLVLDDPLTFGHYARIVKLATQSQLPTIYGGRDYAEAGGLMSYGASYRDMFRRAATFVDRILKGANPGDLPIEQPTVFELVINLKTAKALGLTIPPSLLSRADQVIE